MKDPKIHNIVFIIYFYVYKKNHDRIRKTKMTCKIVYINNLVVGIFDY